MRPSFVCHTRTVLSLPPDTPSSPPGATSIDSTRWLGWICFHVDDGACRTPLFSLWLLGARVSCLFLHSTEAVSWAQSNVTALPCLDTFTSS